MKKLYTLKLLLMSGIFFAEPLSGNPVIAPIKFRPSSDFKQIEKDLFSTKVTTVLMRSFSDMESLVKQHNLTEVNTALHAMRQKMAHFSLETLDDVFNLLLSIKNGCIPLGQQSLLSCQQLNTALLLRAMVELSRQSDAVFVEAIAFLEENGDYWQKQYAHPHYYFFQRSPLKWFKKISRKNEIITNKKSIADIQQKYEAALGENALLRAEFNDHSLVEEQFAWVKRCCVDLSKICLNVPLNPVFITQENCVAIIKELNAALKKQDKRLRQKVQGATMPGHFERNWALYAGLTVAGLGVYLYMKKKPDAIHNAIQNVRSFFVKNYTNHLKEPLLDVKKALFVSNDEVAFAAQKLKVMIDNTKSSPEVIENLKRDYVTVYTTVSESLDIPINSEILGRKSEQLDQDYLDNLCQEVANSWQKGGFIVESYWNPLKQTTKSKVLNVIPDMGILMYRVAKFTGRSIATNAAQVLISRIDELEKKLNLAVAMVSLLPAYFVMTKTVSGIRSFGGLLLPKGYDDTPIKSYIIKMQDLLDDLLYIDSLEKWNMLDARSVGKLLYYGAQLEGEIKHLSQRNRVALKSLLEKFYITNDLKGKHLYLKKMLDEYASWTRFIQNS